MESIFPETENQNTTNEPDPELFALQKSGANWFYWIAGLSLVNSAIYVFGGDISFVLGLAITQLFDGLAEGAIAAGAPDGIKFLAVGLDLVATFIFFLFGYFANKGIGTAFIVGSIVYLIDGLLYLALGSVFAGAFHAFALFFIIRGFLANRKITKVAAAA